jgi:hypothetical protein
MLCYPPQASLSSPHLLALNLCHGDALHVLIVLSEQEEEEKKVRLEI